MTPEKAHADTYLKIVITLLVVLPLVAVFAAMALLWNKYIFASDLILLGVFFFLAQMGVTVGYHRMLTHQGFQAPGWVKFCLLTMGATAFEGTPVQWTATHIKHHAHSDEEDDPHSPLAGFWHAHCGWLFSSKNYAPAAVYAPHLLQDRVVMLADKWAYLFTALSVIIPFAVGGWTGLIWGAGVRIFLTTHVTYSVNSICHTFGRRDYQTTDESRNNWVVALLAMGEGWHNNHHAFPRSAFHGMKWWQLDVSGIVIHLLEKVGLAWDVQRVPAETADAQRVRSQQSVRGANDLRMQILEHATALDAHLQSLMERQIIAPVDADGVQLQQSIERIADIRKNLGRATHMKKVRLQRYMKEVQDLASTVRISPQKV